MTPEIQAPSTGLPSDVPLAADPFDEPFEEEEAVTDKWPGSAPRNAFDYGLHRLGEKFIQALCEKDADKKSEEDVKTNP